MGSAATKSLFGQDCLTGTALLGTLQLVCSRETGSHVLHIGRQGRNGDEHLSYGGVICRLGEIADGLQSNIIAISG